jgi:hypothetical protein
MSMTDPGFTRRVPIGLNLVTTNYLVTNYFVYHVVLLAVN